MFEFKDGALNTIPLSDIASRIRRYETHIPDEAFCGACKLIRLHVKGVFKMAEESLVERGYGTAGRPFSIAACRCTPAEQQEQEKRHDLSRRRKASGLPESNNTWDTWNDGAKTRIARDAGAKMVDFRKGTPAILMYQGVPGVGKTTLLECIGHAALERGLTVRYLFMPEVLEQMRGTVSNDNDDHLWSLLDDWIEADLLLMDDLGLKTETEWGITQITTLVDERYRDERRLIVTTNLGRDGMVNACGLRVADRLFDDVTNKCRVIAIGGTSYRTEGEQR